MDSRRPMPRSMEWTEKDSVDERYASSKPKAGIPPSSSYTRDARDLYRPYEPSSAVPPPRDELYTSSTGYSAAPPSTYASTGRTRLAPRGFQMESSYEDKVSRPSATPPPSSTSVAYPPDEAMFAPSRHRTKPVPDHVERHESHRDYKLTQRTSPLPNPTASDDGIDSTTHRGMRSFTEEPRQSYRSPPPSTTLYKSERAAESSNTPSDSYTSPVKGLADDSAPRSYLASAAVAQPSIRSTNTTHDTSPGTFWHSSSNCPLTFAVELHQLVELAFAAIDDTRAQHAVLFDLTTTPLRFNVEVADRAVKSMEHMVRALTEARDKMQQLSHAEASAHSKDMRDSVSGRRSTDTTARCNNSDDDVPLATYEDSELSRRHRGRKAHGAPQSRSDKRSPDFNDKATDHEFPPHLLAPSFDLKSLKADSAPSPYRMQKEGGVSTPLKPSAPDDVGSYHRGRLLCTDTIESDVPVSYLPTKVTPPAGRSMFAEFDRKMQEIRDSLNAIASREALTMPSSLPTPHFDTGTSSNALKTESFEEYLKAFKSDLAKFNTRDDDNPAISPAKAAFFDAKYSKHDADAAQRAPYSTP